MIVEERMRTYINSLDMGNTSFLEELERKALVGRVPIIRKEMQSFLKMFLAATRPMKILERKRRDGCRTEITPKDCLLKNWQSFFVAVQGKGEYTRIINVKRTGSKTLCQPVSADQ